MNQRAVIDLGTNTFHLLIVEVLPGGVFQEIFRERIFVKLAEDGIDTIGPQPWQRACHAMQYFKKILDTHQIDSLKAFGTAALRTATNGQNLIADIEATTGITVQLIDGLKEARLIHRGVRQVVPFNDENQLIMDIGGGSVEFIIANQSQVHWSASFLVGVGILYQRFHHNDPISQREIIQLQQYLGERLAPLFEAMKKFPVQTLTGASGTFDTMADMMPCELPNPHFAILNMTYFDALYNRLIHSTLDERRQIPQIPEERIEMIVVAMVLVKLLLSKTNVKQINVSAYAMKEGMLCT